VHAVFIGTKPKRAINANAALLVLDMLDSSPRLLLAGWPFGFHAWIKYMYNVNVIFLTAPYASFFLHHGHFIRLDEKGEQKGGNHDVSLFCF